MVTKKLFKKIFDIFFSLFKLKHWPECLNLSYKDKVNYYYNYSINKTFYISANQLFNKFQKFDFYVIDQPVKIRLFDNSLFKYLRNQFISIEFLAKKK